MAVSVNELKEIYAELRDGTPKQEILEKFPKLSEEELEELEGKKPTVSLNAAERAELNEKILQDFMANFEDLELTLQRSSKRRALFRKLAQKYYVDEKKIEREFKKKRGSLESGAQHSEIDRTIIKLEESDEYLKLLHWYKFQRGVKDTRLKGVKSLLRSVFKRYEDEKGKKNVAPKYWTQKNLNTLVYKMESGGFGRELDPLLTVNVLNMWGRTSQILKDLTTGKYITFSVRPKKSKERRAQLRLQKFVPPDESEFLHCLATVPELFKISGKDVAFVENLCQGLPEFFTEEELERAFIKEAITRVGLKNVSPRDFRDYEAIKRNIDKLKARFGDQLSKDPSTPLTTRQINAIMKKVSDALHAMYRGRDSIYKRVVKTLSHKFAMYLCFNIGLRHGKKEHVFEISDEMTGKERNHGMKGTLFANFTYKDIPETGEKDVLHIEVSDKYHERNNDLFPETQEFYEQYLRILPKEAKSPDLYVFKNVSNFNGFLEQLTETSGLGEFLRDDNGNIKRDKLRKPLLVQGKYLYSHGLRKVFANVAFGEWGWELPEIMAVGYWDSVDTLINDYLFEFFKGARITARAKALAHYEKKDSPMAREEATVKGNAYWKKRGRRF